MIDFNKLLEKEKELNTMAKKAEPNPEVEPKPEFDPNTKIEIERTDTWMNLSKSGKGISIVIKDDFEKGDRLTVPVSSLLSMIEGERTGVNIGKMIFNPE